MSASADWPESARVRVHPRAAYQVVDGRAVVVIPRRRTIHYLDEIATELWKRIETPAAVRELVAHILESYDVDEPTAREDVRGFLAEMLEKEMIEVLPGEGTPPPVGAS